MSKTRSRTDAPVAARGGPRNPGQDLLGNDHHGRRHLRSQKSAITPEDTPVMLLRRVARPLLSAAFIGQGLASLRNPDGAADAARPAMEGLQRLPASAVGNLPGSPKQFALINAAIQIAAGVLLATGKTPRLASAALAATMIPGNLGAHMFWTEGDPDRKADERRAFLTDLSLLGGLGKFGALLAGEFGATVERRLQHWDALCTCGAGQFATVFDTHLQAVGEPLAQLTVVEPGVGVITAQCGRHRVREPFGCAPAAPAQRRPSRGISRGDDQSAEQA